MQQDRLIPLDDYRPPRPPTDESMRRWGRYIVQWLSRRSDEPMKSSDALRRPNVEILGNLTGPPVCQPAIDQVSLSLSDWLAHPAPNQSHQVLILPANDDVNLLGAWSRQCGYRQLEPPAFDQLLDETYQWPSPDESVVDETRHRENHDGARAPLVIPQLERWYVRHYRGLRVIRKLLDWITHQRQPLVIGCTSWAWNFLSAAVGAAALLPPPQTIRPFGGQELLQWFRHLRGKDDPVKLFNDLKEINYLEIGVVLIGAWILVWVARTSLPKIAHRAPTKLRLYILATIPIIRLITMVFAILWITPMIFNLTLQNFFVIAGGASVAIGFAFKDYVSSLFAGIVAVFERPYRPGDWVRIREDYGEVLTVGLRAIRLRTPSDDVVTIPHNVLWTSNVNNSNDGSRTLMCITDLFTRGVHDARTLRMHLRDVLLTSAYLDYLRPMAIIVRQRPWGTHYELKAYPFDMRDQFAFISDLTIRAKMRLAELGVAEADLNALAPAEETSRSTPQNPSSGF